ncbi:cation:proton antiporter, partial [bacterium]
PWLAPGLSSTAYLFLGATMTATSVGITARVLQDLGKSDTGEARIIIGAAVIDDVLGLIILAVVSSIVTIGTVEASTVAIIIFKALVFLGGGMVVGAWIAPRASKLFARIHTGASMKFAMVVAFGLVFAYLASLMGLAPIVGAFTGGLILKPEYFEPFDDPNYVVDLKAAIKEENVDSRVNGKISGVLDAYTHKHIQTYTEHLGYFMVPIFFVLTGMQVKIATLADPKVLLMSVGLLVAAVITKVAAGLVAGKGVDRLAVGIGMIPRGEVGLIFANMGKGMGVMDDTLFSAIIVVIMATTLLTPPALGLVFKRR